MRSLWFVPPPVVLLWLLSVRPSLIHCQRDNAFDEIGKTTAQLAQLRGFTAITHNITVDGGYILSVARMYSPLINQSVITSKPPVIFLHGLINSGNTWLVHSIGAQPKDYSQACDDANEEQLQQLAASDPDNFNSIAIALMNCGRELWVVNRRGTLQSRGHQGEQLEPYSNPIVNFLETFFGQLPIIGNLISGIATQRTFDLSSFSNSTWSPEYVQPIHQPNPRYWNFSLDDEAEYDFPQVMECVLNMTGQDKVDIVAHSAGGEMTLMGLSLRPDLSDKIEKIALYAPSMYLLDSRGVLLAPALPLLTNVLDFFPPSLLLISVRRYLETVCVTELSTRLFCDPFLQLILGFNADQDDFRPGYTEGLLDTTSDLEFAQVVQTTLKVKTHLYDYMNPIQNQIAYGQPEPPVYNVSNIRSTQSFAIWSGNDDALVPNPGVQLLIGDLKAQVERHFIDEPGVFWNHFSYFFNAKNIPKLVTVPSIIYLR